MPGETTSWTITVPKETDTTVRSLLEGQDGDSALSRFVVDAVRWRLLNAGAGITDSDPVDELQAELDAAVEQALDGRDATAREPGLGSGLAQEIARGLSDIAEGRVQDFDVARIVERGRKLSGSHSHSG